MTTTQHKPHPDQSPALCLQTPQQAWVSSVHCQLGNRVIYTCDEKSVARPSTAAVSCQLTRAQSRLSRLRW